MLHGHLYLPVAPGWEPVIWKGLYYTIHPPISALICAPFVALGLTNQTFICTIVGAIAVACAYRYLAYDYPDAETYRYEGSRDREERNHRALWLTAFFAVGTVLWYEASQGTEWGFCLVASTIPTLLALTEVKKQRSPLAVGLWAGVAALTRYDLVMVWPVYAALIWKNKRITEVLDFAVGVLPAIVGYFLFQHLRFGGWHDITLSWWYAHDPAGAALHPGLGPFSLHYLPGGLYTAAFMAPNYSYTFPWIRPSADGEAIIFTSPALFLALRAKLTRENICYWAAIVLSMAAALCVWANGFEQFGARYWIQALPFFLALMAGIKVDRLTRGLIILSILLIAAQGTIIRIYGWP